MSHKPTRLGSARTSGILLHVTSLPGPFGIGDLGPQALKWVDALARAGQTWWQILPLGPPGAGNSPYQCFSAFAGNPLLISPETLVQDDLLSRDDVAGAHFPDARVAFDRVVPFKMRLLATAHENFRGGARRSLRGAFERFRSAQQDWLNDFALFMALKEAHSNKTWTSWPRELVRRKPAAMREAATDLKDSVERNQFVQFLFYRQMDALRAYAHSKGIGIIGDLPMFVSPESSDVWAEPGQFLLDDHGRPKVVAGVPPDYFSKTGQRWGNPLYNWKAMRRDCFRWWVRRVRASLAQADVLRIDHFRGLEAYWEIPASQPTAQKGRWVKAPGAELLETLRKELGPLPLIAEDLGDITPPVEKLRDDFSLPGMRVLQFAFGGGSDNPFLPHNHVPNAVAYTGTHDNDTAVGWFKHARLQEREHLKKYAPDAATDPASALLRLAWSSVARTAIAPIQDVLRLGSESRMNLPGQPTGNWTWRLSKSASMNRMLNQLAELTKTYGRAPS